ELSRLREQLLYCVAHELRGPLAVLDNALEMLSSDYAELSADEFGRLLASARRTATRLHGLMDDLLSAGSIQSGGFKVHSEPVQVAALGDDALDTVAAMIERRGQRIERVPAGERLTVLADARYAGRVLANLLSNASKYSPEGEVIRVRAEHAEGYV